MQFTTKIDKEKRLAYTKASGRVAPRVFEDALLNSFWHDDFDPTYSLIVDLTDIAGFPLIEDAKIVTKVFRAMQDCLKGKVAVVAPSPVVLTIARLVAVLGSSEGLRLEAFRSVAEAREWLGVDGKGQPGGSGGARAMRQAGR